VPAASARERGDVIGTGIVPESFTLAFWRSSSCWPEGRRQGHGYAAMQAERAAFEPVRRQINPQSYRAAR